MVRKQAKKQSGIDMNPLVDAFSNMKSNMAVAKTSKKSGGIGSLAESLTSISPDVVSGRRAGQVRAQAAPAKKRKKSTGLKISRIRNTSIKKTDVAYPQGTVHQFIIVPSTRNNVKISSAEFQKRINETKAFFSKKFGGYTSVSTSGGWVSDNDKLIKEAGAKVISYSTKQSWTKANQRAVIKHFRTKCAEWKQEALAYGIEDDIFYLKPL